MPTIADTKRHIADLLKGVLGRHLAEAKADQVTRLQPLQQERSRIRHAQRSARSALAEKQSLRSAEEALLRAQRFRKGLRGLWDRLTGHYARIRLNNETDAMRAKQRDGLEQRALIQNQLSHRRFLQHDLNHVQWLNEAETAVILNDIASLDIADRTRNITVDQA